jgi:hypothetical protein
MMLLHGFSSGRRLFQFFQQKEVQQKTAQKLPSYHPFSFKQKGMFLPLLITLSVQ